jgi:glycosyltransferase involved in cell wall biosynthesis
MSHPEISIVIPSYKAESTIKDAIKKLREVLDSIGCDYEVIVVEDGIVDKTKQKLEELSFEKLRLIQIPKNLGKGNALRLGISKSSGSKYIGYVDADLDISPDSLAIAFQNLETNESISLVLGSKLHKESQIEYPFFRNIQSRFFAFLVDKVFEFRVNDTQTGLKLGRSAVMKIAASQTEMDGFAFDLELLLRLKRLGGQFDVVPVKLNYKFGSTISPQKYLETIRDVLMVVKISLRG